MSKTSTSCGSNDEFLQIDEKKQLNSINQKLLNQDKNDSYLKNKKKTELCKNWSLTGSCLFKNKVKYVIQCSFAHGKEDIIQKKNNN